LFSGAAFGEATARLPLIQRPTLNEDNALVVSLKTTVKVPAGEFHECLKTEETTPLEPDALEDKYYAAGVGNVLTVDLEAGERIKLVKIHPNNE